MINYLIRIKDGPFVNRLGIIVSYNDDGFRISFNLKTSIYFKSDFIEILYKEPQFNQFGVIRCNWCGIKLKSLIYKTNKYMYYCPNCLR